MKVFIEKEQKTLEIDKNMSGSELLKGLQINPTTVLLVKNNTIVMLDALLTRGDDIRIISVISGG